MGMRREMGRIKEGTCCQIKISDGEETPKKWTALQRKKDEAALSSLFVDIVLPACHCILNHLADKVADN